MDEHQASEQYVPLLLTSRVPRMHILPHDTVHDITSLHGNM
jgi:hypothetical protein